MDLEEAVKIGFLLVPPQSFLRKTWMKRFCAVFNFSNRGIQRVELFESEDAFIKQNPCKIIPLADCIKVSPAPQKQQPNVFEIRTQNSTHQFSADTFQDMSEWLTSLQSVAFGKKLPKLSGPTLPSIKDEKQEENMLYSSMEEPEIYSVKAVSTDAILRNKLVGNYKLVITPVNLSVAEECSQGRMGRIILTWPYRHIRRYGCTTENFSFEAGRKCASGEGLFTFSTSDGMRIFQSVDGHVLALKSSQPEFDVPSSPSLNDDKNFFTSQDSLLNKTKLDQPSDLIRRNENEASLIKQLQKPVAPLSKPPRKSKPIKTYISSNITHTKVVQNEDSKGSFNLYEELFTGPSTNYLHHATDSTSLSHMAFNNLEEHNLSMPDEKSLCYSVEKLHMSDTAKRNSSITSLDYENYDPFLLAKSAVSKPIDHIYGKLLNTKQALPKDSSNTYGTILPKQNTTSESLSSPMYSNVPYFPVSHDMSSDNQQEPDHFLKNDVEYAQVFRKNDNSFM